MKHKSYKHTKYGVIVAAGMLLMALPMTVMAQKNTEAAATAELETTTEDSTEALESANKEEAATSENDADTEGTTAAGKEEDTTTSTVIEDKTKTSEATKAEDETKSTETAKDEEEEAAAPEKSTEDVVEDAAAAEENGTESKSKTETATETAAETESETETTAAETTAAELKSEDELASSIIGTWAADENTGLSFNENNKGKLIIPDEDYAFSYKIDGDQLSLDFVSSKATDGTYTASVSGDTLTLVGGKGTIGGTFELSKSK